MLNKKIILTSLGLFLFIFCLAEVPKISEKEYKVRLEAESLQKKGDYEGAVLIIDEWAKKKKNDLHPNLYEYRGSMYAQLKKYKKARSDYFKAYQLYPTIHNVTSLGLCHLNLKDYFVAENVFRGAMINYPESQNLKKGLLQCLFHQNRMVEALSLVKSLLIEEEGDVELLELLGQIHWQMGKHELAFENYQFIYLMNKANVNHLYALLDLSLLLKLPGQAIVYGEKIIKKINKIDSLRAENIALSFINNKTFDKAEAWIKISIKNVKGIEKKDHLLIYLAEALMSSNIEEAKKTLDGIVDPKVKTGRYYFLLGRICESDNKISKSVAYFLEAKSYEAYRNASLWKLYSLYQSKNDVGNCVKVLSELKRLEPVNKTIKKLMIYYSAKK
ncbi:MAG: hypothetical protein COA79_14070 [Planctomycetota bacterium]|nr:MAG: hypothetical protein COA79_14070 [Planctomycetota bacterium]